MKPPIEMLAQFYPHGRTSNGLSPKIFGCTSFAHVHSHNKGKLDRCAIKCVSIGYSSTQKGYKCYNPLSKKLYITTYVTFTETKPHFSKSYLRGETSSVEDKDFGYLDLSLTSKRFIQFVHIHEPCNTPNYTLTVL